MPAAHIPAALAVAPAALVPAVLPLAPAALVAGFVVFAQSHCTNSCVWGSQTFVPGEPSAHMQLLPGAHSSSSSACIASCSVAPELLAASLVPQALPSASRPSK
jgi:hypothetical protein